MAGRLRSNDPVGVRRRTIEAAAAVFQAHGYHAAGMQEIIRDLGVSRGAVFHHFPTKKDLALAVITEHVSAEVEACWMSVVRDAPNAARGVMSAFDGIIDGLVVAGAVKGCPLNNLALELCLADRAFREAIDARYDEWRDTLRRRLDADVAAGRAGYAAADTAGFAAMVVSIYSGAMAMAKAAQDVEALRACRTQLARLMAEDLPH